MPTSLTSTYLVPAIMLNPAVVLHIGNTVMSHVASHSLALATSPHEFLRRLGPVNPFTPYFDIHMNDPLCWGYTIIMVFVQIMAFGQVSGNRYRRKRLRAKKEADRVAQALLDDQKRAGDKREAAERAKAGTDGKCELPVRDGSIRSASKHRPSESFVLASMNGRLNMGFMPDDTAAEHEETSEEETIL